MKRIFLSLLLAVLCICPALAADDIHFTRLDSDTGLPDNSIRAILQDKNGLIWICSREGICMYDGNHFKTLEDPSCEILGGLSIALLEDDDNRLWFISSKGIGYFDLLSGEAHTVFRKLDGSMTTARIAKDRADRIWFAASEIYCWDPRTEELISYAGKLPFAADVVESDENGQVWFLSVEGDLYRRSLTGDDFELIWKSPVTLPTTVKDVCSDGKGHILFTGAHGVVMQVDTRSCEVRPLLRTTADQVRAILPQEDGSYWVGTDNGINVISADGCQVLRHSSSDPTSLSGDDIWVMYQDRKDNIWVGMFYNGLSIHTPETYVKRYSSKASGGSLSGDMVRALALYENKALFVGTEDGGLNRLNFSDESVDDFTFFSPEGGRVNVQSVLLSDGNLWVATFGDGVFIVNPETGKVLRRYLKGVQCVIMYRTVQGELLVGTSNGLYRYDRAEDDFYKDKVCDHGFIHAILEDSEQWLWVGTYGSGLWLLKDNKLQRITTRESEYGLTSDYITYIGEDSSERVWVCTESGGIFYVSLEDIHQSQFRFRNITRKDGLTSNVICAMVEDPARVLWFTSSHGIVKLDPDRLNVQEIFVSEKGGVRNQYAYGSALIIPNGRIFFGTSSGLVAFSPSGNPDRVSPEVFLTDIVANTTAGALSVTEEGKTALGSERVKVKFSGLSTLSLYFSSADFGSARSLLYETNLRRNGHNLQNISDRGEISYANLDPGIYTFQVRSISSGTSPYRSLEIDIIPPFHRSVWAIIIYILAGLLVSFLLMRQIIMLRRMKMSHQEATMEARMQQELYNAKINFFTNITHEIRTPLTLIKMPLDKIAAAGDIPEKHKQDFRTMQVNTERLLVLTNQLLDIRKMEKNQLKPSFMHRDITETVRASCAWFQSVLQDQHIVLEQSIPDEKIIVDYDADMVGKILGNLLSNAMKYGNGHVKLELGVLPKGDIVRIRVNSDGPRIPEKDKDKIFDKFYQSLPEESVLQSKGTGLGLPFALSLARTHGGTLYLDRSVMDYNSFVLELPVHQDIPLDMPASSAQDTVETDFDAAFNNQRHVILVVEDDADMRGYIARELSEDYNVLVAHDGENAMSIVESQRVDLVVSDIMMPGMDGCTLCNIIKSNVEFCHIPVILLTAAVGMETRIETLQAGADGYIEKPFSIELLKANIANLFKNREIANNQFVNSPLSHFNSVVTGNADQEFMDRLHEAVMEHLSDSSLNIEMLTAELGTSKSTLYRKVTTNTGLNINEYIRVSRLKKAAEMLSSQQYRISEVAYQTGFSSPSYFATCFQKQFNISPSAFVKGLK